MEVKKIAQEIGAIPSKEQVKKLGRYPIKYYEDYFISWGEVCAAARTTGMSETRDKKRNHRKMIQLELFK